MAKKSASGSSRELVYSDGKSNKFWTIRLKGSTYTVTFGRVGTAGQSQEKAFDSPLEAKIAFEKMVAEKLAKGYEELDIANSRQDNRTKDGGQIKVTAQTEGFDLEQQLVDPMLTPATAVARQEMSRQAVAAIATLADRDAEILVLRHLKHLSNQEVAQVLGLSEPAASMRYLRALRRLRAKLKAQSPGTLEDLPE